MSQSAESDFLKPPPVPRELREQLAFVEAAIDRVAVPAVLRGRFDDGQSRDTAPKDGGAA